MTPDPVFPLEADFEGSLDSFFANAFVTIEFRAIPEPSSAAIAAVGLVLMGAIARRNKRA
jgi:hypothetical protein